MARALVTAGVKILKPTYSYGYIVSSPFSTNDYNNPGNWRRGYGLDNSTCFYDTTVPLYQPDWCRYWTGLYCDSSYLVTSLDVGGYS